MRSCAWKGAQASGSGSFGTGTASPAKAGRPQARSGLPARYCRNKRRLADRSSDDIADILRGDFKADATMAELSPRHPVLVAPSLALRRREDPDAVAAARAFGNIDVVVLRVDRDRMGAAGGRDLLDELMGLGVDDAGGW